MGIEEKMEKLDYKVYEGSILEQMPKLIADGRRPATMAELMHGKLDGVLSWDEIYSSGDMVFYHPSGTVKIVTGADIARQLSPKSDLKIRDIFGDYGVLVLPKGLYELTDGQEFTIRQYENYCVNPEANGQHTKERIKDNPFWNALAGEDVLSNYVDEAFRLNAIGNFPCFYLREKRAPQLYVDIGKPLKLCTISEGGSVTGDFGLGYDDNLLVGVAPEVHGAEKAEPAKASSNLFSKLLSRFR